MQTAYETMYILRPDLGEEQVEQIASKFEQLIGEQEAENIEVQNRGKRRLAYEIGKHRDGIYIQMNYTNGAKAIAVMEKAMRLSEEVIRYLTIKQSILPEQADTESEVEATATAAV